MIEISAPSATDPIKHLSARLAVAEENVRDLKDHSDFLRDGIAAAPSERGATMLQEISDLIDLSPKLTTLTEATNERA